MRYRVTLIRKDGSQAEPFDAMWLQFDEVDQVLWTLPVGSGAIDLSPVGCAQVVILDGEAS